MKLGKDPDKESTDEDAVEVIPEVEEELEVSVVDQTRSCDETRGAAIHYAPDYKYENLSQQLEWERIGNEKSRAKLEDTRESHPFMLDMLDELGFSKLDKSGEGGDGNPSFEFDKINGE
jgi:hypothetical protein